MNFTRFIGLEHPLVICDLLVGVTVDFAVGCCCPVTRVTLRCVVVRVTALHCPVSFAVALAGHGCWLRCPYRLRGLVTTHVAPHALPGSHPLRCLFAVTFATRLIARTLYVCYRTALHFITVTVERCSCAFARLRCARCAAHVFTFAHV